MANRVLRDWTTSEKIDSLTELSELFFVRLIMKADDHGCFHANPKLLKAALFPLKDYSENQMALCLKELEQSEIVQIYEHDGRKYLKINDFGQRLRNMVSKFPQPADNARPIDSNQPPETKRNEVETETNPKPETEVERIKFFGSGDSDFILIPPKYASDKWIKIIGGAGLNEFYQANMSSIKNPELTEKFLREKSGAHFEDFKHIHNTFIKFSTDKLNGNAKRKNTNSAELIAPDKQYGNKW